MVAIVSGGSSGIGLETARALLNKGFCVVCAARKSSSSLQKLLDEFPENAAFCPCDISNPNDRQNLILYALSRFGSIDLLVNCAGVAPRVRKDMLEITPDDFDFTMDINLKGTFFLTQLAARIMLAQKSGRIVFISSVSADTASVNRAEYCISKAGVSMMNKLFCARLARDNISVFEIRPGIIDTDMIASVKDSYAQRIQDGLTPVARLGMPSDIAAAVCALASGAFDFCTGSVINADGGFSVRRL